ncbi:MAG: hypothetical protein V4736_08390 [Bdellovibrionota bacterium]
MTLADRILTQLSKNQNFKRISKELKTVSAQLKVRSHELNLKLNREGGKRVKEALRKYHQLANQVSDAQKEFDYELAKARTLLKNLKLESILNNKKASGTNSKKKASGSKKKTTRKAAKRTSRKTTRKA